MSVTLLAGCSTGSDGDGAGGSSTTETSTSALPPTPTTVDTEGQPYPLTDSQAQELADMLPPPGPYSLQDAQKQVRQVCTRAAKGQPLDQIAEGVQAANSPVAADFKRNFTVRAIEIACPEHTPQ